MRRGALRNLIEWQIQELDVPPRGRPARTLQFAPISFDVHFQEIFGTLCAGGVVCLIDDDMRRDAIALLRHIESEKIERIFTLWHFRIFEKLRLSWDLKQLEVYVMS